MSTTTSEAAAAPEPSSERKAKKPLWRRILKWFLIVLLALILLVVAAVAFRLWQMPKFVLDPMTPGALTVDDSATGKYQIGDFSVELTGGEAATLTITQDDGQRVVWRSDPGSSFAAGSANTVAFEDQNGFFWAQVDRTTKLTDQSITSASSSRNSVKLSGALTDGETSTDYEMTLTPERKSAKVTNVKMKLEASGSGSGGDVDSLMIASGRDGDEGVYGFGEQYRPFDLSGSLFPILVGEQGLGRGDQPATLAADLGWGGGSLVTTYAPLPTYVTEGSRSLSLVADDASGSFAIADMTQSGQVSLESFDDVLTVEVLAAASPSELVADRSAGISRPDSAEWINDGAIIGIQGGTDIVRARVKEMQDAGTKISGVFLQDWVGQRKTRFGKQLWWSWQLNKETYPDWDKMVADFAKEDIRIITYMNPYLSPEVPSSSVRSLYNEAEKAGYLVKNASGDVYELPTVGFPIGIVDLTNPKAKDWYADVVANEVLGVGASGFMADFAEYLPMDSVLHTGEPEQQHNRWPALWAETVRTGCERAKQPDCMVFFRSAYLGSEPNVSQMWNGDQMVNFKDQDGLASAILGSLSGGVSGFPLWHSDIGGYTSFPFGKGPVFVVNYVRPPELNQRWSEYQALAVLMRSHESNAPDSNAQVYDTPESRKAFAEASQLYVALANYRKGVIAEATRTGVPAMRHGWLVYPGTAAADVDLQYFLGNHLLVAPVTEEGATEVSVTFPPGEWRHILTGEVFPGDQETMVGAPLGQPAAFVKEGDRVGDRIIRQIERAGITQNNG